MQHIGQTIPDSAATLLPRDPETLRDEIDRQIHLLALEAPVRAAAVTIAFGISLIFLPAWIVAPCAIVTLAAELYLYWLHSDPDRLINSAGFYRSALVAIFVVEACFALPPVLLWHVDDPYVKALAVGILAGAMMHLATVRAIHLPTGLAGAAALGLLVFVSNTVFWLRLGDYTALALSSLCAVALLGYFTGALISNHRLHRESAVGRARAQAADAAKSLFLAQMSHELRTPMNAIMGMGHAELDRSTDPLSRERLSVLITAAEGLSTLLDDILDLSAVQEGRMPIRAHRAIPRDEITATVELFRPGITAAGLELTLELDANLTEAALFDSQRLRQCLSNLLSNALKHTRSGGVNVTAARINTNRAEPMLWICVADTGPGVPAQMMPGLFRPFNTFPAQIDTLRTGQPGGNGLGLSIARALARQMGGDLVLMPPAPDAPDGMALGACFILTLALADPPAALADTAPPAPKPCLAGKRVLVVDDIATNRLVAIAYLQKLGSSAVEATSGAQALSLLAQET
ncbi:MAG: ATP-binding protein, partial [Paracoccaceae bacterium]|nr:ATP-binding protein [Paracoccaceae bacterium]